MALNEDNDLNELLIQQLEKEKQLSNNTTTQIINNKPNNTASLFNIFSILLIILGVVIGIVVCTLDNLIGGIALIISGLISSAFMKAIAEIIQLLEDIKNRLPKK